MTAIFYKTFRALGTAAFFFVWLASCLVCGPALAVAQGEAATAPKPSAIAPSERPDPTRFALAVEQGDLDRVGEWLATGLPADFRGDRIGSGLMIAAWEGNVAMMELFVRHGATVDLTNRYDEQALQLAAWRGHLAAVQWLLDHGAIANRPGAHWTALHYAAFANRPDISRLLIKRGAEVNARAPNGSTVLMMAAREGHADLARQILDAGADAQAINEHGDSALTWAMRHGNFTIAQMVSSQPEFAQAAKADPTSFGTPVRSVAAPPEIDEILRQIRLAEAAKKPTDKLRATLHSAIERFKRESRRIVINTPATRKSASKTRGKPGTLLITARRPGTPGSRTDAGERAELVYATPSAATRQPLPSPQAPTRSDSRDARDEITDILAQMQHAQAAGQSVDTLRKALYRAVARLKNQS